MKPKAELIEFMKGNYPSLQLGYDSDGGIWSVHNGTSIYWDNEIKSWRRSCMKDTWFHDCCKKIK